MASHKTEELFEYFATCSYGFESLLANELKTLSLRRVRPLQGGVAFFGTQCDGYTVCLWSRLASRVLRVLSRVSANDAQDLYQQIQTIPWERYISPSASIAVSARGTNASLRNTQFVALKVKDGICGYLRSRRKNRPDVRPHRPDVSIWVSIHKTKATISLDYSGESLHKRGYRLEHEQVDAPLKESLAAGMLTWGGWQWNRNHDDTQPSHLVDPTCGSGTLVLEAAMMATDRAPGLSRDYWGFAGHADFDEAAFATLLDDADNRFEAGLKKIRTKKTCCFVGVDIDEGALEIAQGNAKRLGLNKVVSFVHANCAYLPKVLADAGLDLSSGGFVVCNPPYGVRLLSDGLETFYEQFSSGLQGLVGPWKMVVITPDPSFDTYIGYDAQQFLETYNGAIAVTLRSFCLDVSFVHPLNLVTLSGKDVSIKVMSEHAEQFAARLRKMLKARNKWARKNKIYAYRVYDADLPDYAVSVDIFIEHQTEKRFILLNEYQAPKEIDTQKAKRRFMDACQIVKVLCEVSDDHLFTRVRRQEKGGQQYQKDSQHSSAVSYPSTILVEEAQFLFEVNLSSYLDTGLFLDHRITRQLVSDLAYGKHFLNLFAYTGTASVYAAFGGALSTTTVDMNKTYLEWARRNMSLAGYTTDTHRFVRADVLQWIEGQQHVEVQPSEGYGLVFVDPPTFSNSKFMGKASWDIQRDHVRLLKRVTALLAEDGMIVFSGNLRSFKLDEQAVSSLGLRIENITAQTIPEDFSRNARIHFCYLLTKETA